MNTTSLGRQAEEAVAEYLKKQGYKILDRNWRTRWCEIDIIAQKNNSVYFVEVKYRVTNNQGDPAEYVTAAKLNQMAFAAQYWVSNKDWCGDMQLAVAPVIGESFSLGSLIFID